MLHLLCLSAVLFIVGPLAAHSQSLPEAPSAMLNVALQTALQEPSPPPAQPQVPAASLQGVVTDPAGDPIDGAQIVLYGEAIATPLRMTTDDCGCFHFDTVPPGRYTLSVTSDGFNPRQISGTLSPGQQAQISNLALPVGSARADVTVTMTLHDEAELEMKDEETQRIAGFLPNFYVTYNWHAAPMSAGEKWRLTAHTLIDPVNNGINVVFAAVEQANNTFPGYGQGTAGFAKRFGANTGDFVVGSVLGGAVFPVLLHQDPRYFYKGTGRHVVRFLYAVSAAVICRGDNGKWQPNYSGILGDLGTGGISNLYYPAANRTGLGLTFENGGIAIVSDAINNVLEEFVFRKVTPHAPTYAPTPVVVKTP